MPDHGELERHARGGWTLAGPCPTFRDSARERDESSRCVRYTLCMGTLEERQARRAAMTYGKAETFAEHEAQGVEFWANVSKADRFQAIVELVNASWYLQGRDGPPPRLDRTAHGARRLGS